MGIVFGVTGAKEPAFSLIASANGYEIRRYPQYFIAEVPMMGNNDRDANGNAFNILAKYIGSLSQAVHLLAAISYIHTYIF